MKILNLAPASLNDKHGIASWFRYYFQGLIESNHEHELYFVSTRNKKGVAVSNLAQSVGLGSEIDEEVILGE